jgi:hypothetical protein
VGLVWSQRNADFFGRDHAHELLELPWRGWTRALTHARVPYLPVHVDDLDSEGSRFAALILPNVGALSDAHVASVRHLVQGGCTLIATGRTGLYDESGVPRADFAFADLLGAHYVPLGHESDGPREILGETQHTYLRIEDKSGFEQLRGANGILAGFQGTNILPFGGWLGDVIADAGAQVLLTYIPPFPIYPPETSWMREPRTHIPGLIVNSLPRRGKVAFLCADIDRRYAMDGLPDHENLLVNLARWATGRLTPLQVEGPGLIDCRLYRQGNRLILHLVNLTSISAPRGAAEGLVAVGPLHVSLALPERVNPKHAHCLVSGQRLHARLERKEVSFTIPSLQLHEVLVIG